MTVDVERILNEKLLCPYTPFSLTCYQHGAVTEIEKRIYEYADIVASYKALHDNIAFVAQDGTIGDKIRCSCSVCRRANAILPKQLADR